MEKIEIPTAQNVKVEYQLGSVVERGLAFGVDNVIIGLYTGFIALFNAFILGGTSEALIWIMATPVFIFYHLSFEVFNNGQSPGKKLMGLRVVKTDGKLSDFKSYLIRFVFRMVDIYATAFSLGVLCIVGSTRNQRLGDMLADTTVVKVKGGRRFSLAGVRNGQNHETEEIQFPEAKKMNEEEMLVIQETVIRYKRYKNQAHTEALQMAVQKVEDILGIKPEGNPVKFLEAVLKDYVRLTR